MPHVMTRKLERFVPLSRAEKSALVDVIGGPRVIERNTDIVCEGDTPSHVTVLLEGVACCYNVTPSGRRQIVSFQHPGDMGDLPSFVMRYADHNVAALTRCAVAAVAHKDLLKVTRQFPQIAVALWRDTLAQASIFRQSAVNLGIRNASERVAHLLCEQFVRLRAAGMSDPEAAILHVTQSQLAEAVGLSLVHTNRTLKELRMRRLVARGTPLRLIDFAGLRALAGFDERYLYLARKGRALTDQTCPIVSDPADIK